MSDLSEGENVDGVAQAVFSLMTEATIIGETAPHQHAKAQLMYVISGVVTIEAAGGIWTVPPHCAVWIPSGTPHSGRVAGHIKVASLYLDPAVADGLDEHCGIVFVQPLLRELILRFDCHSQFAIMDRDRRARLASVLLDELLAAPLEPIHLPMPTDSRLKRLTEAMIENPAQRFTIDEWGARVGASNRTLSRLFQRETGLSFVRWRQQLHVGLALQRLAKGDLVTTIAGNLGYESVSAFIAMFRRMLGTTPARYFDEVEAGTSERSELRLLGREQSTAPHSAPEESQSNVVPLRKG